MRRSLPVRGDPRTWCLMVKEVLKLSYYDLLTIVLEAYVNMTH